MSKKENVLGNTYGKWTVIDDSFKSINGVRKVLCRCSCELKTEQMVILNALKRGISKSCRCDILKHKVADPNKVKKISKVLEGIKKRCWHKNNPNYKNYGGRGIKVCPEWSGIGSKKNFVNWVLENGYEEGLQIDRIDNDGNYEPSNCRFVTCQENSVNKRKTKSKYGYYGINMQDGIYGYEVTNNWRKYNKSGFKTAEDAAIARDIRIIIEDLNNQLEFPENIDYYLSIKDSEIEKQKELDSFNKHHLKKKFYRIKETIYKKNLKEQGINICDEWLDNPILFYRWALSNGYDKKLILIRKDENIGWNKENCMFVTREKYWAIMKQNR